MTPQERLQEATQQLAAIPSVPLGRDRDLAYQLIVANLLIIIDDLQTRVANLEAGQDVTLGRLFDESPTTEETPGDG